MRYATHRSRGRRSPPHGTALTSQELPRGTSVPDTAQKLMNYELPHRQSGFFATHYRPARTGVPLALNHTVHSNPKQQRQYNNTTQPMT